MKEFVAHADQTYKVDLARQRVFDQAEGINRIRLAHCFCLPDNHDAALKYGGGKATTRSDVDGVGYKAQFHKVLRLNFGNENLFCSMPDGSEKLEGVQDGTLDPNDLSRIKIHRTVQWVDKTWADSLKEYGKAMKMWKSGTGGGPGAPENYADWRTRSDEEFAKYSKSDDKGDWLAYMYMLDKRAGFIFNIKNEPAPSSTVTEDGAPPKNSSQDRRGNRSVTETFADKFSASMDSGFQMLSKVLAPPQDITEVADDIETEGRRLAHIQMIEKQIQDLLASNLSPRRKEKRRKVLDDLVESNYSKI